MAHRTKYIVEPPPPKFYPESDGEPMADSDAQYEVMTDTKFGLVNFFREQADIYVAANLLIYYEKGDPTKRVAPDVFVAKGVGKRRRSSYQIWAEMQVPSVVFEIASPGTWQKDIAKRPLYERLRIPEYFMLDPFGDLFGDVLLGYRLAEGGYVPLPYLVSEPNRGIYSEQLGLELWSRRPDEDGIFTFRFRNPASGEWLLGQAEAEAQRLMAAAEVERLSAELERLRKGQG